MACHPSLIGIALNGVPSSVVWDPGTNHSGGPDSESSSANIRKLYHARYPSPLAKPPGFKSFWSLCNENRCNSDNLLAQGCQAMGLLKTSNHFP
jgi:hypothetical protein